MGLYRVEADISKGGISQVNGENVAVVSAENAANARVVAAASMPNGVSDAAWAAAAATEIVEPTTGLEGFRLRIQVQNPATGAIVANDTVTGLAAADMDALGALMETALNANTDIAGASYTAVTNTLIIAAGTGADDLGDHRVLVSLLPPTTWSDPTVPMPAFIGTITDEGLATADLSVVFVDAATPGLIAAYGQGV